MAERKKTTKKKMPKAGVKNSGKTRSKAAQLTDAEIEEQSIADALESIRAIEESVFAETDKETGTEDNETVDNTTPETVTLSETEEPVSKPVSEAIPEAVEENENDGNAAENVEDVIEKRETTKKDYAEKALFDLRADIDGSKKKQQLTTRQLYGYDHMGMIYD